MSQREGDGEVSTNTTSKKASFNIVMKEPIPSQGRGRGKLKSSTRRCTDQLHSTTATNNDSRHTTQHVTRQPKRHAETQQQQFRNDHSHDGPEKDTLTDKRRQDPRARPQTKRPPKKKTDTGTSSPSTRLGEFKEKTCGRRDKSTLSQPQQ